MLLKSFPAFAPVDRLDLVFFALNTVQLGVYAFRLWIWTLSYDAKQNVDNIFLTMNYDA